MNINTIFLEGFVGRDPELRYTQNKTPILSFSIAWSNFIDGKAGPTSWFDAIAFGPYASLLEGKIKKGQHILLKGRCEIRSWEGRDGLKRQKTQIIIESVKQLATPEKSNQAPVYQSEPSPIDEADIPF